MEFPDEVTKFTVTQQDLDDNPLLVVHGLKVGDEVDIRSRSPKRIIDQTGIPADIEEDDSDISPKLVGPRPGDRD